MNYLEIDFKEFEQKKKLPGFELIDVREAYEFEENNIGGRNIPMGEILSQVNSLRDFAIICICCASGKRSKTVAYHLGQHLPESTIYSLKGGVKEYHNH